MQYSLKTGKWKVIIGELNNAIKIVVAAIACIIDTASWFFVWDYNFLQSIGTNVSMQCILRWVKSHRICNKRKETKLIILALVMPIVNFFYRSATAEWEAREQNRSKTGRPWERERLWEIMGGEAGKRRIWDGMK